MSTPQRIAGGTSVRRLERAPVTMGAAPDVEGAEFGELVFAEFHLVFAGPTLRLEVCQFAPIYKCCTLFLFPFLIPLG